MASPRDDLKARIDAIEESYEFFLAYAAQGLSTHQGAKSGGQLREFLERTEAALDGLSATFQGLVTETEAEPASAWEKMAAVLEHDAEATLAAVRLVASRPAISSQLIDNLNANIHLRALLTDLFLLDDLIGD